MATIVFMGISKAFISIFATEFATNGFSYFGAIVFFVAAMGQLEQFLQSPKKQN